MRTRLRAMRPVPKTLEPFGFVAGHCLIALLHLAELHEHSAHPLDRSRDRDRRGSEVSSISRYAVKHQP